MTTDELATELTIYIRWNRLDPTEYRDTRELILAWFQEHPHISILDARQL